MDYTLIQEELKQMILSVDSSVHDIEHYGLVFTELNSAWNTLINGECLLAYHTYGGLAYQITKSGTIIKTIQLMNADKDFTGRYTKVCNSVDLILSKIDTRMSDVEKVLIIHDYIVSNSKYKEIGSIGHYAGGPLGLGFGVCEGYTDALRLLCKLLKINNSYIVSNPMNHQWVYVQLDGEWYHIDTTWDDTQSTVAEETSHTFFVRNDSEFLKTLSKKHYSWFNPINIVSNSTKYVNWFVHDVVGNMCYADRYWYYVQSSTNCVVRSKIDGSSYQVLVDGRLSGDKLKVVDISNNKLHYLSGTNMQHFDISTLLCDIVNNSDGFAIKTSIENINLKDFSMWRTGNYSLSDGKYAAYPSRVCLLGYTPCNMNTEYMITCTNPNYHVLVREMTDNSALVKSNDLTDGAVFTSSPNTTNLAISLYYASNSSITFDSYVTLFTSGFTVKFDKKGTKIYETLTSINLCDYASWRPGHFNMTTGIYEPYGSRICLKDYVSCSSNTKYTVSISNSNFDVLIREMSSNLTFLKSSDIRNGNSIITTANTKYLAISIYNNKGTQITDQAYQELFQSGFCISIE